VCVAVTFEYDGSFRRWCFRGFATKLDGPVTPLCLLDYGNKQHINFAIVEATDGSSLRAHVAFLCDPFVRLT
jgi:hypothetical protein